jgi:hypothetical protein
MAEPITVKGWQVAIGFLAFVLWIAGDFVWLSMVDHARLDCLATDGRSARRMETIVCTPLLLGQGVVGWLAFLWIWGPPVAMLLWFRWLRRRKR